MADSRGNFRAIFAFPCIAQMCVSAFLPTQVGAAAPLSSCASTEMRDLRLRGSVTPLIVLDAGHGGHDPGSLSGDRRYSEKDAALSIATAARRALLAAGMRVRMTRARDRFVSLYDRRELARRYRADLFVSIHADSASRSAARGATIYTLSDTASDAVAARLAERENRSSPLNGIDMHAESADIFSMLVSLSQRETMNISARFSSLLQREEARQGVHFKTKYHRFAGFAVLKAPDVPAVLFETGYISNASDAKLLSSKEHQDRLAVGLSNAVIKFFDRGRDSSNPSVVKNALACDRSTPNTART
jgi:N-acetylmuramoyl-L-alanine amidase